MFSDIFFINRLLKIIFFSVTSVSFCFVTVQHNKDSFSKFTDCLFLDGQLKVMLFLAACSGRVGDAASSRCHLQSLRKINDF